jgi:DNA polymerase delta subunit 2
MAESSETAEGGVVVVGVMFKEMRRRPDVVQEHRDRRGRIASPQSLEVSLTSDDDIMWLEDGVVRLRLEMLRESLDSLVTGLVVAVRGAITDEGRFRVFDWCFGPWSAPLNSLPALDATSDGPFVALMSGLHFGGDSDKFDISEARFGAANFLSGRCKDTRRKLLASRICRIIVCGGVVAPLLPREALRKALGEADAFFVDLAAALHVDLMPGASDPANHALPQDPMHPYLFPEARKCGRLRSVTNPYEATVGELDDHCTGFHLIGHSGQPVMDIMRCSSLGSLDALMLCLRASHLAPTAPDTLAAQPFRDTDPFVMKTKPHLLFSGGSLRAQNQWLSTSSDNPTVSGTQCVCVPSFYHQPAVVLISMRDLRDVRIEEFCDASSYQEAA